MTENHLEDRASVLNRGFVAAQRWSIRIVAIAAAVYVVGWLVGKTWALWFPIAIALLFATVLVPPARWLRSRGVPGAAAAGLTMLGLLAALGAVFSVIIPQLVDELPEIANRAAAGLTKIQAWLTDGPIPIEPNQLENAIDAIENWLKSSATQISTGVLTTIGTAAVMLVQAVLILMLTFFFVKDGHLFLPLVRRMVGDPVGRHITGALTRTWNTLGGFIRIQGLVSLIDAVLIGAALVIFKVPLAVPLALITLIGGFIPIIGAFVAGALAVLVTLVTNSPRDALIILVVIIVVQQLEGNVLSPMLQGKSMNLHPAVVLLSVMAGGSMFGLTGAFLAVPVVAAVAELMRYANDEIAVAAGEVIRFEQPEAPAPAPPPKPLAGQRRPTEEPADD